MDREEQKPKMKIYAAVVETWAPLQIFVVRALDEQAAREEIWALPEFDKQRDDVTLYEIDPFGPAGIACDSREM